MSAEDFPCNFCDFRSKWENGVKIHIGRKHVDLVQLDGNDSLSEVSEEDENYLSIETYFKDRMAWMCLSEIYGCY